MTEDFNAAGSRTDMYLVSIFSEVNVINSMAFHCLISFRKLSEQEL